MTELVTSGSVGGMASNGCLYPEIDDLAGNFDLDEYPISLPGLHFR